MPYIKLSAATQKLGLEFDKTEYAQLPNGKKVGYPVSGTDYSLYYGGAIDGLATFGPIDINLGLAMVTRGSSSVLNMRMFAGSSMWVNDIFEVRALAGLHILGIHNDSYVNRYTLGFALEVLCPVNDWVAMTLTYSPSISGDQILTLGVGWLSPNYLPKGKIRSEGFDTAMAQTTQTLTEIKGSLSADNINEVARKYSEPAHMAFRRIIALGNAVNYMVYPQYPWVNPNGLGFSEWVAKAKGEVAFAKSLGPDSWSQDSVSKLEQEVDNLPGQIAITLATDFAADKYGILKTLQGMRAQNFDTLKLSRYAVDYRFTVSNLENITTDPTVKKKVHSIISPIIGKLDELDAIGAKPL